MSKPEPTFVLRGPAGTLVAHGIERGYRKISDAQAALRSGAAPIVVGALPFDIDAPAALQVPSDLHRLADLPDWPVAALPDVGVSVPSPDLATHRERVLRAVERLAADTGLEKVVLARALAVQSSGWDARTVLRRLTDVDPTAYGYLVDLSPAGPEHAGTALIGASPELLVARSGSQVTCRPFAGTAPRSPDPETDRATGSALLASAKNQHEHRLVVEAIRDALAPLCSEVQVPAEPELHQTDALWHLGTPITGILRETSTTALDLALALHPTPAVGGSPTGPACALIEQLEGDRGFYAGAVGWCDAAGDGLWVVAIRCAVLSADRRHALAHSGGGIVAESDPDDEVAETTAKFRTILTGLGVVP